MEGVVEAAEKAQVIINKEAADDPQLKEL